MRLAMRYIKKMGETYSPLYFLSALGAGGLAISFYMYLMWFTPHEGSPVRPSPLWPRR
jgi:hypothetical protein